MANQVISTYGLIGYPLSHSLSHLMHNTAFEELGVDAIYKLFPLEENELDNFFAQLKEKDSPIFGLNVTVPYKEKIIKYLDGLSPYAQKANAVNTIVISKDRKLKGFNTDGPGFLTHITELNFDFSGANVAILGAGGATRAIIVALCVLPQRPASIKIYDLYPDKAKQLLDDLAKRLDVSIAESVNSIDDLNMEDTNVLINATPIGMKKDDPCLVDEDMLRKDMFVYDLIYNPAKTKLLELAQEKGAKISNGLGMLFYQGVLAFQHWAGVELENGIKEKMRKSLQKGLTS